jgi:hypothetical protein
MFAQGAGIDSIYESAATLRHPMTLDDKNVTMRFFRDPTTLVLVSECVRSRGVITSRFFVFGATAETLKTSAKARSEFFPAKITQRPIYALGMI